MTDDMEDPVTRETMSSSMKHNARIVASGHGHKPEVVA